MKIAITSAIGGGVETYVRIAAKYLLEKGHTVHVVYCAPQTPTWPFHHENLYLHAFHHGSIHYYLNRIGITKHNWSSIIRCYEYSRALSDKLQSIKKVYGLDIAEISAGPLFLKRFNRIPIISKIHGPEWYFKYYCEDGQVSIFEVNLTRRSLLASCQIHSLSRSVADFASGACRISRSNIYITPYPFEIELFTPATKTSSNSAFNLMSVGRLETRKGTHTIVRAMPQIWKDEPDTHLYLFGANGNFGKAQIEAVIPESEHRGRIHFKGFVQWDELVRSYQNSDIYVSPTRYETFGYTLLEAMACGCPVIASDIGPVPELVRHGSTGWLVIRDDVESLAKTIVNALRNRKQREAYGRSARRLAEQFDVNRIMPRQVELYERAISGQPD